MTTFTLPKECPTCKKKAVGRSLSMRERLAKCEPVIEFVCTFQTLNRQAIADGHTEWTEAALPQKPLLPQNSPGCLKIGKPAGLCHLVGPSLWRALRCADMTGHRPCSP